MMKFNAPFGATYLPVENINTEDARFNSTFKKPNNMSFKIPHILEVLSNFLDTEEGKRAIIDYVIENNLWNDKLKKEIEEYYNETFKTK